MKGVIPLILLLSLSVPALAGDIPVRGAPGPLLGAGLPVLLVGGGIYWIVRRKKKASVTPNTIERQRPL
jgi:LPXTG-motif cell wall-anchored protein